MSESSPYPECRHILPGGQKCHAPALRGKLLCYFHARSRTLIDHNRYRTRSVALPPLEDRASLQMAINEVLAAFAAGKIDRRAVWPYLCGIQMAARNLAGGGTEFACKEPVEAFEEHFQEVIATGAPDGSPEDIAPASESSPAPVVPGASCDASAAPAAEPPKPGAPDPGLLTWESTPPTQPRTPETAAGQDQPPSSAATTGGKSGILASYGDLHLPVYDTAATHEYDAEPLPERPAQPKAEVRYKPFSNRHEENEFYKQEYAWLNDFHARREAAEKASARDSTPAASPPGQ